MAHLVFLLCVLAFVLYGFVRGFPALKPPRPGGGGKAGNCDWTGEEMRSGSLRQWRCETCGVTAYSRSPGPPVQCKSGLDGRL